MKKFIKMAVADILIAALMVLGLWASTYLIQGKGVQARSIAQLQASALGQQAANTAGQQDAADQTLASTQHSSNAAATIQQTTAGDYQLTNIVLTKDNWKQKFADKFSPTIVSTDTTYKSPNLSIEITKHSVDSGVIDTTSDGKHTKYGTRMAYVLADVYVGDITCLQTAFAQDTYGVGYTEKLSEMSDRMKSILSINGDSYSNNRHKNNGTIIRNGVIYRSQKTDMETCVLNWDGTMKIYGPDELNLQTLIHTGAYQSWIFGPSLLDENGKAKTDFLTWDYIRQSHPRTAIGYYEPGHYVLMVVDGRQQGYSRGMFLDEIAAVFEQLGCKAAYNLDGGHCSFMDLKNQTVSHPYRPDHEIQDGVFITEGL